MENDLLQEIVYQIVKIPFQTCVSQFQSPFYHITTLQNDVKIYLMFNLLLLDLYVQIVDNLGTVKVLDLQFIADLGQQNNSPKEECFDPKLGLPMKLMP